MILHDKALLIFLDPFGHDRPQVVHLLSLAGTDSLRYAKGYVDWVKLWVVHILIVRNNFAIHVTFLFSETYLDVEDFRQGETEY